MSSIISLCTNIPIYFFVPICFFCFFSQNRLVTTPKKAEDMFFMNFRRPISFENIRALPHDDYFYFSRFPLYFIRSNFQS
jgi:hypothetical protein